MVNLGRGGLMLLVLLAPLPAHADATLSAKASVQLGRTLRGVSDAQLADLGRFLDAAPAPLLAWVDQAATARLRDPRRAFDAASLAATVKAAFPGIDAVARKRMQAMLSVVEIGDLAGALRARLGAASPQAAQLERVSR